MKYLLHEVAIIALLAVFAPAWAQTSESSPSTTPSPSKEASAPATSGSPAISEKSNAPEVAGKEKAASNADNWVQPKRPHRVHRGHRYARPHSPPYGSPYYWDYRWVSPADHMANALNAGMPYSSWGWGWGARPYHDSYN